MKRILFYILLFLPYLSLAQISNGSDAPFEQISDYHLKKNCLMHYLEDVDTAYFKKQEYLTSIRYYPVFSSIQEIFDSYFKNVRIYIVVYTGSVWIDDGRNFYPKLYAINVYSGKLVSFKDEKAFYDFINSSEKKISSLDKAYLYLYIYTNFLQKMDKQITEPVAYNDEIRKNSIFAENGLVAEKSIDINSKTEIYSIFNWNYGSNSAPMEGVLPYMETRHSILNSNRYNITVYAYKWVSPKSNNITYRYKFSFDEQSNLYDVKIDTLK